MPHMSLAAAGSSPDSTGGLDSTNEMHGCLHGCKGLNLCVGLVAGARRSALSCELSDKVIKVLVEYLHGGSHLCSI